MTKALAKIEHTEDTGAIERVLLQGDLSRLTEAERLQYYRKTCESLKLNWLTKPFEYIVLNKRLTLYARKDCTDQLRKLHGVSIGKPDIQDIGGNFVVTVIATDATGRQDSDVGVVAKTDMGGNLGNALMKAITKAKRRVTLSICGLGMLDETEVETIPDAQIVPMDTLHAEPLRLANTQNADAFKEIKRLASDLAKEDPEKDWDRADLSAFAQELGLPQSAGEMDKDQLQTFIKHLEQALQLVREERAIEDGKAATAEVEEFEEIEF